MKELESTFSKEQYAEMRKVLNVELKLSDLMSEVTDTKHLGEYYSVRCPFHATKTQDAGRLKNGNNGYRGMYFCNHPDCLISREHEGKIDMTSFWKLANDFPTERAAVLDLWTKRLKRPLPEGKGTPMTKEERLRLEKKMRMNTLMLQATVFYFGNLYANNAESKEALRYLKEERGFSEGILKTFFIGYATGGTGLRDYLLNKGFSLDEIKEARLLSKSGKDAYYKRIIYPMFSENDNVQSPTFHIKNARVVNFYSRMLPSALNEANSGLKHRYTNREFALYNLTEARRHRYGLMIEGAADTIASIEMLRLAKDSKQEFFADPSEIGPFASYGTNGFGEKHLPVLDRANFDVLYIAGDRDSNFAGQTANIARAKMIQEKLPHLKIRIVEWEDKDVNQMLVDKVPVERFMKALDEAVSLEEYELRIAIQKIGVTTSIRNQFELLNRLDDLLKQFSLDSEDFLKYSKTLKLLASYLDLDLEDILMHLVLMHKKEELKEFAKKQGFPLQQVLLVESLKGTKILD